MSKVLISGFYGFGNLGDEAILETMLKRLEKNPKIKDIVVLSNNPKLTEGEYLVKGISRKNILAVIKAIISCDVLISGGGSLLQDVTSKKSIFYYFFIIAMGIMMNKKVMLYSHGIGPITLKRNRVIAKFLLNRVDCITVRESNSMSDLLNMGIRQDLIHVTADPVIDMEKGARNNGIAFLREFKGFDPNKKCLGISIRTKDFLEKGSVDRLETLLYELIDRFNVIMMPFYLKEDLQIAEEMSRKFDKIIVLNKKISVHQTLDIISCFNILIGTRLHSLIFGAVCNVPLIGMTYDPKIDYFLETLGQKPAFKIENFDKDSIMDEIEYVENESDIIREEIRRDVELLRKKLDLNDILLSQIVV